MKVYEQGVSIYVIGTDDVQAACRAAGITPNTHHWSGTDYGMYVRRQGRWKAASESRTPKDAKPGVCFVGPVVADEIDLLGALGRSLTKARSGGND